MGILAVILMCFWEGFGTASAAAGLLTSDGLLLKGRNLSSGIF